MSISRTAQVSPTASLGGHPWQRMLRATSSSASTARRSARWLSAPPASPSGRTVGIDHRSCSRCRELETRSAALRRFLGEFELRPIAPRAQRVTDRLCRLPARGLPSLQTISLPPDRTTRSSKRSSTRAGAPESGSKAPCGRNRSDAAGFRRAPHRGRSGPPTGAGACGRGD